jgi:hypothetical protein
MGDVSDVRVVKRVEMRFHLARAVSFDARNPDNC